VVDALGDLLAAADADPSLEQQTSFRFDAINVAVQCIVDEAFVTAQGMDTDAGAIEVKDYFLSLMDVAEQLLLDQPERMLGYWIAKARMAAGSPEEADLLESNARHIVTTWGEKDSGLHEYAFHTWAGLVGSFYKPRWEQFFQALEGDAFDQDDFNSQVIDWEGEWTSLTVRDVELESQPNGQGMEVARRVYEMLK
jgi:alpha-N-acetylglucosaminidase